MNDNCDNDLTMEDNAIRIEKLFERVAELVKTSLELFKLKTTEKTSEVVSTLVPYAIVFILISTFMLLLNVGLALWLGKLTGNTFLGFFIVAAFYAVIAVIVHFFMQKWLKKVVNELFIKLTFKKGSDE
jgi:hypothetical protein